MPEEKKENYQLNYLAIMAHGAYCLVMGIPRDPLGWEGLPEKERKAWEGAVMSIARRINYTKPENLETAKVQPCPICDTPLVTPKDYFPALKRMTKEINEHGELAIRAHEFNKSEDNTWTTEWPAEQGDYWFYGYHYGKGLSKPELKRVSVRKDGTGKIFYTAEGDFLYKEKAEEAHFKKAVLPAVPEI